jgi:hypothetical protein
MPCGARTRVPGLVKCCSLNASVGGESPPWDRDPTMKYGTHSDCLELKTQSHFFQPSFPNLTSITPRKPAAVSSADNAQYGCPQVQVFSHSIECCKLTLLSLPMDE